MHVIHASQFADMLSYQRYKASSHSVQSLQDAATKAIVSQLGKVPKEIDSRFTCSGKYEIPSDKPIKLVYRQPGLVSSEWIEFPGVSDAAMIKLLDACSVANYGDKRKNVIDKSYRNAFKLEPDNFVTSFQICSTPILQEIQSIIPTVVGIRAELYKLNIYAGGGFFRAHDDTPRSVNSKMFGRLVVCLPTQFTGGELIVRHHKQEIKYDWSSDTSSTLHWAAFFSDIEHEVLPVSEGYRVTLIYNLSHHSETSDSTFDVKTYSFYKLLQATLSNPVFMRDGGVLGFSSEYSYVYNVQWADLLAQINTIEDKADTIRQLDKIASCNKFIHLSNYEQMKVLGDVGIDDVSCKLILDSLPSDLPLLKGADYIVVESAKLLGLPVCVMPFLSNSSSFSPWIKDSDMYYAIKDFSNSFYISGSLRWGHIELWQKILNNYGDATCRCKIQDITWCQNQCYNNLQPAGKDYQSLWYKSTAILIRIPRWSDYRQRLIAISTGECCGITEVSEADEGGMVKDFKGIIQDYKDIVQDESQQVIDQLKEFLSHEYILDTKDIRKKIEEVLINLVKTKPEDVISTIKSLISRTSGLDYEDHFFMREYSYSLKELYKLVKRSQ